MTLFTDNLSLKTAVLYVNETQQAVARFLSGCEDYAPPVPSEVDFGVWRYSRTAGDWWLSPRLPKSIRRDDAVYVLAQGSLSPTELAGHLRDLADRIENDAHEPAEAHETRRLRHGGLT
ncbi:MAG: hypothetical protein JSU63_07530 [Phycisphaerales bacterium]|nr:MAG: hypothetical protein JSU63_07530 [Phycisphaerales bacterium]